MSTTPTPLPQTDEEVAAYIRQIAAEEARKASGQTAPAEPTPAPAPAQSGFKMSIAGQEYSFNSPEEASAAMNNLLNQQAVIREQNTSGRRVTSDDTPSFDMKVYVDKMAQNPIEAAEYLDEFRPAVKNMRTELAQTKEQLAIMIKHESARAFRDAHPEYVGNDENANTIDSLMKHHGLPWTPQGIEAAYLIGKQKGMIKGEEQEAQPQYSYQPVPQQPYNPYTAAPPVASRTPTAESTPGWASDMDNLSPEQIESVFARFRQ